MNLFIIQKNNISQWNCKKKPGNQSKMAHVNLNDSTVLDSKFWKLIGNVNEN